MTAHYRQLLYYYRGLVALIFVVLVGGTVALSVLFLFVAPLYSSSAKVSLLPTETELAFSQTFVRGSSIDPANLLTQTHVEYLLSRDISAQTVDRLMREMPSDPASKTAAPPTLTQQIAERFHAFRNNARRIYNMLNSGKHVDVDPLTDAVLSLQDSIEIAMIEGTYILEVTVSWGDPEVAAAAANFLAEEYVEHARAQADEASRRLEAVLRTEIAKGDGNFTELEDQINSLRLARANNFALLRVIDPAVPGDYPSFPRVVVNTVIAIAGWIMASGFLVICADTFSGTLKTSSDLERIFGARALGTLPLKRPKLARLADLARSMNLQCSAIPCEGAVTVVGSDEESRRLTAVTEVALRRLQGWQKLKLRRPAVQAAANSGREAALRAVPDDSRHPPVVQLDQYPADAGGMTVSAQPRNGAKVTDLGGAEESFSMRKAAGFDWVVIGLRRGATTEETLQSTVARLRQQGVEDIFGVFLKG